MTPQNIPGLAVLRANGYARVTFLATVSGMTLLGIGSAFRGLVLGGICHLALRHKT